MLSCTYVKSQKQLSANNNNKTIIMKGRSLVRIFHKNIFKQWNHQLRIKRKRFKMKMRLFIMDNFEAGFPFIRFMTFIFVDISFLCVWLKNMLFANKKILILVFNSYNTNLSKLPKMWL